MDRLAIAGLLLAWATFVPAGHAEPLRFRWQAGQAHEYQVEQVTRSIEVVGDTTSDSTTRVTEVKRWEVLSATPAGEGTLRLSLTRLRLETNAGGEPLVFDSTAPDQSNPQMRDQLGRFVGVPLAVIRIAPTGKVLEVIEGKFGTPAKFETEPPFTMVLADNGASNWTRSYQITLEPPQGTGERFASSQEYVEQPEARNGPIASFKLTTKVGKLPEAVADQLPLLPLLPEGTIEFDTMAGLLHKATLAIDREITGHQGEGSSYHFTSKYVETRLPPAR